MPVTRKRKNKTRRSSEADMISDLENMDVMIGSNHYESEDSEIGNSVRRPENPTTDALVDYNSNTYSTSRENEHGGSVGNGQGSGETDSSSELNRLSGELKQRRAQKINRLTNSVSMQKQGAMNEAMNEQV